MILNGGGYFSLELAQGREFFQNNRDYYVRRYNSARSAICRAIYDSGAEKVWLPYYLCPSVKEFLDKEEIKYSLYHIDRDFLPKELKVKENEIVLWVNYFGMISEEKYQKIHQMYHKVIFDNTQAFFEKPNAGAYNVYSCRKFFGVSDGAYLIAKFSKNDEILMTSRTIDSARFLLESIETSTNDCYMQSLENERRIEQEGIRTMSKITRRILDSIDYEYIAIRRKRNFEVINNYLKAYNLFHFDFMPNVPMFYPFLTLNCDLRERLICRKIYVPQLWKAVAEDQNSNEWERFLSQNLVVLPIDQRYTEEDMVQMKDIVLKEMT